MATCSECGRETETPAEVSEVGAAGRLEVYWRCCQECRQQGVPMIRQAEVWRARQQRPRMYLEQATYLANVINRHQARNAIDKWTVAAINRWHDDPHDTACYGVTAIAPDGTEHTFCTVEEWQRTIA